MLENWEITWLRNSYIVYTKITLIDMCSGVCDWSKKKAEGCFFLTNVISDVNNYGGQLTSGKNEASLDANAEHKCERKCHKWQNYNKHKDTTKSKIV